LRPRDSLSHTLPEAPSPDTATGRGGSDRQPPGGDGGRGRGGDGHDGGMEGEFWGRWGEYIGRALGYPIEKINDCNEGQAIIAATQEAIKARRAAYVRVASSMGLEPTQSQIDNWQPSPADLKDLRAQLRPERVRAQMLEGVHDFITGPTMKSMRPVQRDMSRATGLFLNDAARDPNGGKSGYLDAPTGVGKTAEFIKLIEALR
ncbi:MAG TPA: hypothetical protein VGS08_00075, partial [Candidatus Saccharimonadales bacterium]|nr:hypothetical protein [Candidatus Saccharimonadales bacterium]